LGVQFYRQKPVGDYIVDFLAPKTKLVVEVDGSQHTESEHAKKDKDRDEYLAAVGLKVLRFNSTIRLDPPLKKGEVVEKNPVTLFFNLPL
jgi:very-short-patch-repair endonuclease